MAGPGGQPSFKPKTFKGGTTNYSEINDWMNAFSNRGELASTASQLEIPYYIDSGSLRLNALVSGSLRKGWAGGRVHTICGHPKTQKSGLVLEAMKNFLEQFEDGFVVLYETEGALTKERLLASGIDITRVRIERPMIVEEVNTPVIRLYKSMEATIKEGKKVPKVLIVIDSINGLLSGKQLDDALSGDIKSDMGTQARELKLLFNFASKTIDKVGMTMLCTAHVMERDSSSGSRFKEIVVSGGMGAIYFSSTIVFLKKYFDRDDDTKEKTGIIVTADIIESRLCTPAKATLKIMFKGGLNRYLGVEEFMGIDSCGVGNGRLADYYDVCKELVTKKVITESNILSTAISVADIEANLSSKEKREVLPYMLKRFCADGNAFIVGGVPFVSGSKNVFVMFTNKALENFKDGQYIPPPPFKVGIPSTSSNLVAEHLQRNINVKELLSSEVMTDEIIAKIDENAVIPKFSYTSGAIPISKEAKEIVDDSEGLKEFFEANEIE